MALFSTIIVGAERTLTDYETDGRLPVDKVRLFGGLVARMYDERRVFLEKMMQLPFIAAKADFSGRHR